MKQEISANATLAHYRIVEKLGAGGRGEVWLAEDTRLDRKIALKLLPAEFTSEQDRVRRFIQEAKAASALNHPNIITIHKIGVEQDAHFIAMEFIDGSTLRRRIASEPFPLLAALEAMVQMTSALVAAHEAGITHRDIKPENVMLRRDGIVKVLDFGLAKLTERGAPAELDIEAATWEKVTTDPGVVMGTPQYMSPEQARDLLNDLKDLKAEISFAAKLSRTGQAERPETVTASADAVPTAAHAALPTNSSARIILGEIKRHKLGATLMLAGALGYFAFFARGSSGPLASLAVLPFQNRSANEDSEYLSDGLAESLILQLSQLPICGFGIGRKRTRNISGDWN